MLKRVFMTIKRGMTDDTPVCVYPWEKPILEEIHGGNAVEVSIDEMCSLKGASKIVKVKLKHKESEEAPSMRDQYIAMTRVDPDSNPLNDPEGEFGRLQALYGMHNEVNMTNVEKVFGNFAMFRRAMRDYASGRTPEMFDVGGDGVDDGETPIAEMSDKELTAKLRAAGVTVTKTMTREDRENALTEVMAAA